MPGTELSRADIDAICATFSLGTPRSFRRIDAGTINSNYSVVCDTGRFFVRVNEGKSEAQVRYEAELLAELAAAGVSTVLPVPARSGRGFHDHDGALISVFPWIEGEQRDADSIDAADCRVLGGALADLHLAGLPIAARFESEGSYSWPAIEARFERSIRGCGDAALAAVTDEIARELEALAAESTRRESAPRGVIHGDLFPDNVLFSSGRPVLIDFEQASTGALVYDVAVAINAWCYRPGHLEQARVDALCSGYRERRELTALELDLLPVELRAAALRFAITRITDVYLPGLERDGKDYRAMLERSRLWRAGAARLPG